MRVIAFDNSARSAEERGPDVDDLDRQVFCFPRRDEWCEHRDPVLRLYDPEEGSPTPRLRVVSPGV